MDRKHIYIFIFLLFSSLVCSFILILSSSKKLEKVIVNYATVETERIANVILNDVIDVDDDFFDNKFFEIIKDSNGNIAMIDFDSKVTNQLLKKLIKKLLKDLAI